MDTEVVIAGAGPAGPMLARELRRCTVSTTTADRPLLMLVPSRGRPDNVADLLKAWRQTTAGISAVLVILDRDDPHLAAYYEAMRPYMAPGVQVEVGPRRRLGPTLNDAVRMLGLEQFAVGFMGDDHRPRTRGWDQRFVETLRELGTGLVYGDDLFQRHRLPTAVAMTTDIVRALGYMVPPGMIHLYLDSYWLTLGRAIDRIRYLDDVVIEHMHPAAGKASWDTGYATVNSPRQFASDHAAFERWKQTSLAEARDRLLAL